jgi:Flp pilus assembly protein TadD
MLFAWVVALGACDLQGDYSDDELAQVISQTPEGERIQLLEVHVTRNPESANARLWLARAYRNAGDPRAAETYAKAIELAPDDPVARIELAYLPIEPALRRGVDPPRADLERAEVLCADAARLAPTCENRHSLVGIWELEVEAGWASPAAAAGIEADLATCGTDAKYAGPWQATLGRVYALQGQPEKAQASLCSAVAAGTDAAADECLALLAAGGDVDAYAPKDAVGWAAVGAHRKKQGDKDGAIFALETASKLDPSRGATWGNLGALYAATGKKVEACAAFERTYTLVADAWLDQALAAGCPAPTVKVPQATAP